MNCCEWRFSGDSDQCEKDAEPGSKYCFSHKAIMDEQDKLDKWKALKELAGHWQDGSCETVRLSWDDATHTAFIVVGKKSYYREGCGFDAALDEAVKATVKKKGD